MIGSLNKNLFNDVKVCYSGQLQSSSQVEYTLDDGLYLITSSTNADNSAIVDIYYSYPTGHHQTRLHADINEYKKITYSNKIVTIQNLKFTNYYSIVKLN